MTQPQEALKTHSGWLDNKGTESDSETERGRGSMFVGQRNTKTKEVWLVKKKWSHISFWESVVLILFLSKCPLLGTTNNK